MFLIVVKFITTIFKMSLQWYISSYYPYTFTWVVIVTYSLWYTSWSISTIIPKLMSYNRIFSCTLIVLDSIPLSCSLSFFRRFSPLWKCLRLWLLSMICCARRHKADCLLSLYFPGCGIPFVLGLSRFPCWQFLCCVRFTSLFRFSDLKF